MEVHGIAGILHGCASSYPHVRGSAPKFEESQKITSSSSCQLLPLNLTCFAHTFSPVITRTVFALPATRGTRYKKKAEQADIRCHGSPLLTAPYSSGGKKRHRLRLLQEMRGYNKPNPELTQNRMIGSGELTVRDTRSPEQLVLTKSSIRGHENVSRVHAKCDEMQGRLMMPTSN